MRPVKVEEEMFSLTSQPLKFCVRVSPYMFSSRQTYILQPVLMNYRSNIPEKIRFVVSNGDVFEGHFLASKNCFIGLRSLCRRYRPNNITVIAFEYLEHGDFSVMVLDSSAVEIEYPIKNEYVERTSVEYRNIPDMDSFKFVEVYSLQDHLNHSLFTLNACDGNVSRIDIYMPKQLEYEKEDVVVLENVSDEISRKWVDGCTLIFEVGNKSWKVNVQKNGRKWCLTNGWPEFAASIQLGESDLLVLTVLSTQLCYGVCLYKDYAANPVCVDKGKGIPRHFIKKVTEDLLVSAELIVPDIFVTKYGNVLGEKVSIVSASGTTYFCEYLKNERKIISLDGFAEDYDLKPGYMLVFKLNGTSSFNVATFDERMVHVLP